MTPTLNLEELTLGVRMATVTDEEASR